MKKQNNMVEGNKERNKKLVIVALGMVVMALGVGLIAYLGSKNPQSLASQMEEELEEQEVVVTIPPIEEIIIDPSTELIKEEDDIEEEQEEVVKESVEVEPPKTKEEAIPPTDNTPPEVNESGEEEQKVIEPSKQEDTPTSGSINSEGAIYIPGFGYVEDSGVPNTVIEAPNSGTGEVIGQ